MPVWGSSDVVGGVTITMVVEVVLAVGAVVGDTDTVVTGGLQTPSDPLTSFLSPHGSVVGVVGGTVVDVVVVDVVVVGAGIVVVVVGLGTVVDVLSGTVVGATVLEGTVSSEGGTVEAGGFRGTGVCGVGFFGVGAFRWYPQWIRRYTVTSPSNPSHVYLLTVTMFL